MELTYQGKKTISEILNGTNKAILENQYTSSFQDNLLFQGNNLEIMQLLNTDLGYTGKIDLVYIDPPFSTNTIFKYSEDRSATISSRNHDEIAYSDTLNGKEFIEFIRERLIFIRELMSDQGSIYFHIDYKIGHYIKIIMDEVFGIKNFRSDITRIKCNPKNFSRKAYGNIKDLILFYTKTNNYIWNEPLIKRSKGNLEKLFPKTNSKGRKYTTNPLHAPGETQNGRTGQPWKGMNPPTGRHWRYDPSVLDELDSKGLIEWSSTGNPRKIIFADDYGTMKLQDIWEFKDSQTPSYPTEKNIDMIDLIVKASSNANSIVFDCFCGSGTTLLSASRNERQWIGIDQSEIAIRVSNKKLTNTAPLFSKYTFYKQIK